MARKTYEFQLANAGLLTRATDAPRQAITSDLPSINKAITPAIIYAKNVLPSAEGFDSLDKRPVIEASGGGLGFDNVWKFTSSGNTNFLFVPAQGKGFIAQDGEGAWTQLDLCDSSGIPGDPSNAFLRGKFYVFFPQQGLWIIDGFDALQCTTTGLIVSALIGIVGASSYLVAYDAQRIYYTSSFDGQGNPDFTPAVGVAGTERILEVRGSINFCLPIANGFILYCSENAVAAQYTGNPLKPFTYREIPGSAGVQSFNDVAISNLGSHFAWTKSGFQEITVNRTQNIFPELTTFFRDRIVEDFNIGGVNTTTQPDGNAGVQIYLQPYEGTGIGFQYLGQINKLKVRAVGNRYIIVSYGIADRVYEFAWVYDLDLKKWGKLDQRHVDIFAFDFGPIVDFLSYEELDPLSYDELQPRTYNELVEVIPAPRDYTSDICMLRPTGLCAIYYRSDVNDQDEDSEEAEIIDEEETTASTIVLGRFTALRQTGVQVHEFEAQACDPNTYSTIFYSRSNSHKQYDGLVHGYRRDLAEDVAYWNYRITAREMAIGIKGRFNLTTAFITMERASGRRAYAQRAISTVTLETNAIASSNEVAITFNFEPALAAAGSLKYYLRNPGEVIDYCVDEPDGIIDLSAAIGETQHTFNVVVENFNELEDTFIFYLGEDGGLIRLDPCNDNNLEVVKLPEIPDAFIEWESATFSGDFYDPSVTIVAKRTGNLDIEAEADYSFTDITAAGDFDYTGVPGTVHFNIGEVTKNVIVPLIAPDYDTEMLAAMAGHPNTSFYCRMDEAEPAVNFADQIGNGFNITFSSGAANIDNSAYEINLDPGGSVYRNDSGLNFRLFASLGTPTVNTEVQERDPYTAFGWNKWDNLNLNDIKSLCECGGSSGGGQFYKGWFYRQATTGQVRVGWHADDAAFNPIGYREAAFSTVIPIGEDFWWVAGYDSGSNSWFLKINDNDPEFVSLGATWPNFRPASDVGMFFMCRAAGNNGDTPGGYGSRFGFMANSTPDLDMYTRWHKGAQRIFKMTLSNPGTDNQIGPVNETTVTLEHV